ncbi:BEACH domain-containing protein B isoform X1 [Tanacetum coccineum]
MFSPLVAKNYLLCWGVSVFFPLFTRIDLYEDDSQQLGHNLLTPITKERLTVEIVELIASVLDENLPNQQQMLNLFGLAEVLVKDVISHVFLNPFIWVYDGYKEQRELYMFLIQQFDNDPRLLRNLCRFPRILDIIRQFYWDNMTSLSNAESKPLFPITNRDFGERPNNEEIQKIRLVDKI